MSDQTVSDQTRPRNPASSDELVIAVSSDCMGRGDDELGRLLLRNHLHVLAETLPKPDVIVFYNSGVRLATQGSPVLEDLGGLERAGTRILLCGTCLGHFGLKDSVAVGEISNMYAITETMLRAAKVINL